MQTDKFISTFKKVTYGKPNQTTVTVLQRLRGGGWEEIILIPGFYPAVVQDDGFITGRRRMGWRQNVTFKNMSKKMHDESYFWYLCQPKEHTPERFSLVWFWHVFFFFFYVPGTSNAVFLCHKVLKIKSKFHKEELVCSEKNFITDREEEVKNELFSLWYLVNVACYQSSKPE